MNFVDPAKSTQCTLMRAAALRALGWKKLIAQKGIKAD